MPKLIANTMTSGEKMMTYFIRPGPPMICDAMPDCANSSATMPVSRMPLVM